MHSRRVRNLAGADVHSITWTWETRSVKMTKWRLGAALVMSSALVMGCSDDDDDPIEPVPAVADDRFVHASGASPAVNITVDGDAVANHLAFGTPAASQDLEVGSRTVAVRGVGATEGRS